jgi:hypothetical protein
MHRSGTSAITGVLHLLGATLGEHLISPQEDVNSKGFWEHANINALHERVLNHLGSEWFDARSLPDNWWQETDALSFREELAELVRGDFSNEALWAVKDPRLCRLLPLWLQVLPQLDVNPFFLLMLRHPAEVAASLCKRDGMSLPHALLLWLRYVIESERYSRHLPRVMVVYEDLLTDWRTTIGHVENQLHLGLHIDDELAMAQVDEFLESKLRHHFATSLTNRNEALLGLAVETYDALRTNNLDRMDQYSAQLEIWVSQCTPWLVETNQLMGLVGALQTSLAQANGHIAAMEQEIHRVKASLSWNVTKPLRAAQTLFKRFCNDT